MTVMHTDDRGAVRVFGELPATQLAELRRLITDFFALPDHAGTEVLVLDLSGTTGCDPELRSELARALLICSEHDAGLRIVPSGPVRQLLATES